MLSHTSFPPSIIFYRSVFNMPRPKGSKNKAKTAIPTTDFDALIAEKAAAKESLTADITALEENLESIKADLKTKKAELKKLDTELVTAAL